MNNVVCIHERRKRRLEARLAQAGVTLLAEGGMRLALGASIADLVFASQLMRSSTVAADREKGNAEHQA